MKLFKKISHIWYDGVLDTVMDKLFGLPKPRSLPMRQFLAESGDFTWEDWKEQAKREHPVRYFLSETLPHEWRVRVVMRIEHVWYWIRCHTYNRYHKLDLRQPYSGTEDDYRWGWIDEDKQLLFACFNVLVGYVDLANSSKYHYGTDDIDALRKRLEESEDDEKLGLKPQLDFIIEAKKLYEYWTIYRKQQFMIREKLLHDWCENRSKPGDAERWDALKKAEEDFDNEEEEMLIRLIKIRKRLWT